MNDSDLKQVEDIAELQVRRYFDQYLNEVFPEQMKVARAHTNNIVAAHDSSRKAHGGVEGKVNKAIWMAAGASAIIGALAGKFLGH